MKETEYKKEIMNEIDKAFLTKKEFNLSEKRLYCFNGELYEGKEYCYTEEDVKEFIKLLKEELSFINGTSQEIQHKDGECSYCDALRIINKLAGFKLI